jgi:hypothetical protein
MSDLAQMANGAASALGGVREEIDNMIRHRLERTLNARGLVTREEFDALVPAMKRLLRVWPYLRPPLQASLLANRHPKKHPKHLPNRHPAKLQNQPSALPPKN